MVQWLGFPAFTAEGEGSIPGQRNKTLQAPGLKKTVTFFCASGKRPNFLNSEQWMESKRPSASPILEQPVWDNSLYRFKDVQKSVKKGSRVDELEIYVLNYERNQDTLILIWSGLLKSELLARKGKPQITPKAKYTMEISQIFWVPRK